MAYSDILNAAFGNTNVGQGRKSQFGHYIQFPITFLGGSYLKYDNKGQLIRESLGDFELPATAVASFHRPSVSNKTRTAGGTVRETSGLDDWRIKIRGLCLEDPSHPTQPTAFGQLEELHKFLALSDNIRVLGDEFEMRGIYEVFVTNRSFPDLSGMPGVFPFEISLEGNEPDEFLL